MASPLGRIRQTQRTDSQRVLLIQRFEMAEGDGTRRKRWMPRYARPILVATGFRGYCPDGIACLSTMPVHVRDGGRRRVESGDAQGLSSSPLPVGTGGSARIGRIRNGKGIEDEAPYEGETSVSRSEGLAGNEAKPHRLRRSAVAVPVNRPAEARRAARLSSVPYPTTLAGSPRRPVRSHGLRCQVT